MITTSVNTIPSTYPPTAFNFANADHAILDTRCLSTIDSLGNSKNRIAMFALVAGTIIGTALPLTERSLVVPLTANVLRGVTDQLSIHSADKSRLIGSINASWPDDVQLLGRKILPLFPDAQFSLEQRTDPDEGWSRNVLFVTSSLSEAEQALAEDGFYELADHSPEVRSALGSVVVAFQ